VSRPPLVYASEAALAQARGLLPAGAVLENVIARLIQDGAVDGDGARGYVVGDGWRAAFARVPGKHRPTPKAWLIHGAEKCSECGRQRSR